MEPRMVSNIQADNLTLKAGNYIFPVTVTDKHHPNNSYVVSCYNLYVSYALYEAAQLSLWIKIPISVFIRLIAILLPKNDLDKAVIVNNFMLSTNLYPKNWNGDDIEEITIFLKQQYPAHAILFRSLNLYSNKDLMDKFVASGWDFLASRQVYLYDCREGKDLTFLNCNNFKNDRRTLENSSYQIDYNQNFSPDDYDRMVYLYNALYIEKYSPLNPQFTADWLHAGKAEGWLDFVVLRNDKGTIDAVAGWFGIDDIISAPIFGYDTSLPQKTGLYRMLTHLTIRKSLSQKKLLNFSSGAAHFKRLRGGRPEIEYSAVFINHLPFARRLPWLVLKYLTLTLGISVMKRMKL